MPFGTITIGTDTYEPRNPGVYQKSGISFGSPSNEFRVRAAIAPGKDGNLRASVTRILEKDVTVGSSQTRKAAIVTVSITTPKADFTSTEIDNLASDISTFLTSAIISRILQGEV